MDPPSASTLVSSRVQEAVVAVRDRYQGKAELATGQDERVVCLCARIEQLFLTGLKAPKKPSSSTNKASNIGTEVLTRVEQFLTKSSSTTSLLDGKNDKTAEPVESNAWPFIKTLLSEAEAQRFSRLEFVKSEAGRCRAWIRMSLNEHLLAKALTQTLNSRRLVAQYYDDSAPLLDADSVIAVRTQISQLSTILFAITVDDLRLDGTECNGAFAGVSRDAKKKPVDSTPAALVSRSLLVADDVPGGANGTIGGSGGGGSGLSANVPMSIAGGNAMGADASASGAGEGEESPRRSSYLGIPASSSASSVLRIMSQRASAITQRLQTGTAPSSMPPRPMSMSAADPSVPAAAVNLGTGSDNDLVTPVKKIKRKKKKAIRRAVDLDNPNDPAVIGSTRPLMVLSEDDSDLPMPAGSRLSAPPRSRPSSSSSSLGGGGAMGSRGRPASTIDMGVGRMRSSLSADFDGTLDDEADDDASGDERASTSVQATSPEVGLTGASVVGDGEPCAVAMKETAVGGEEDADENEEMEEEQEGEGAEEQDGRSNDLSVIREHARTITEADLPETTGDFVEPASPDSVAISSPEPSFASSSSWGPSAKSSASSRSSSSSYTTTDVIPSGAPIAAAAATTTSTTTTTTTTASATAEPVASSDVDFASILQQTRGAAAAASVAINAARLGTYQRPHSIQDITVSGGVRSNGERPAFMRSGIASRGHSRQASSSSVSSLLPAGAAAGGTSMSADDLRQVVMAVTRRKNSLEEHYQETQQRLEEETASAERVADENSRLRAEVDRLKAESYRLQSRLNDLGAREGSTASMDGGGRKSLTAALAGDGTEVDNEEDRRQLDQFSTKLMQLSDMNRELLELNERLQRRIHEREGEIQSLKRQGAAGRALAGELTDTFRPAVMSNKRWKDDSEVSACESCERNFTIRRRKHHCRDCGRIFCSSCCNNWLPLVNATGQSFKKARVCDRCQSVILRTCIRAAARLKKERRSSSFSFK